jgi:hypothetical protein
MPSLAGNEHWRADMSANDTRIEADARDETLGHAFISAKALKEDVETRLEAVEATQFERGYN